jgi:ligand-binding sensor domain-containing protein
VRTIEKQFERDTAKGLPAYNTKMSIMDSQQRIWLLTIGGPCIKNERDQLVQLKPKNADLFMSACEFRMGELIFGSYRGGLYKSVESHDGQIVLETINKVSSSKVYTYLYQHADSLIYGAADLATLDIYDPKQGFKLVKSIPFRVNLQCMVPMNKGSEIWMGTDQGIFIYQTSTTTFDQPKWMNELKELIIYSIVPSGEDIIWLSSNQGIYKLDTEHQSIESFDLHNGTGSLNFNPHSFLHRSNGEICWVALME